VKNDGEKEVLHTRLSEDCQQLGTNSCPAVLVGRRGPINQSEHQQKGAIMSKQRKSNPASLMLLNFPLKR